MDLPVLVARFVLAAMFAVAKMLALARTRKAVVDFGAPPWLASPVGSPLPFAELTVTGWLLPRLRLLQLLRFVIAFIWFCIPLPTDNDGGRYFCKC